MAFTDSARDQFLGIVPDDPTTPTVPLHLQAIVDAVESQVVLKAPDWNWADTFVVPYTNGMLLFVEDPGALYLRLAGSWFKVFPTNFSGDGDPPSSLGVDGDLYFRTTPP